MRWLLLAFALWIACPTDPTMARPETFVPNLLGAWCADTVVGGATPTSITDLSGNGRNLSATGVVIGSTASPWGVVGRAIMVTDGGTQYAQAATAATWAPLHDGMGVTFATVIRPTGSAAQEIIFDTGTVISSNVGAALIYDAVRQRIGVNFVNGLGSGYVPNVTTPMWSPDGSFTLNTPHSLVFTFSVADGARIWVDGLLSMHFHLDDRVKTAVEVPALGAGAPAFPLRLFSLSAGIQLFIGEMDYALVTSNVMSQANREAFDAYAVEAGVTLKKTKRGILMWDGNSLVDTHWKEGVYPTPIQFPLLVNDQTRQLVRPIMRAVAGLSTQQMIDRVAKHVTPEYDATLPFNILVAWELVNSIANGETKEASIAQYWAYCDARRAAGWKVIAAPMLPHRFATEAQFDWLLADVLANWASHADAVVRIDLDANLGSWAAMVSDYNGGAGPKVYRTDGVHFTTLGNEIASTYFRTAINSFMRGRVIR